MFILPRIIYNLFLWVCWEWGLSVSLERQKENKTGEKEKRGREEERPKKKMTISGTHCIILLVAQVTQLVESGLHAASCSPESRHVDETAWRKRLLFLVCMKMPLFATSRAHPSSAIWGSVPLKSV